MTSSTNTSSYSAPTVTDIDNDAIETQSDTLSVDKQLQQAAHSRGHGGAFLKLVNSDNADEPATTDPSSKVSIKSISSDVAIATAEEAPSIATSSENNNSETSVIKANDAKNLASEEHTDNHLQIDVGVDSQTDNSSIDMSQKSSSSDPISDATNNESISVNDTSQSNDGVTENEAEDYLATETEDDDDEFKEVKEAKLESYKQFIAEQFSNKKIDYPEVRVTIEANALPSKMYFVMNTLSAIIASYGLVINSAAVVIGAMLVAMMLGPITGIALAIIDYRMPLLRKSLITVTIGVSLVILVGFVVGWLHKGQPLTAEILSRTQPTSMDLMIALAGGTAGAYAMVSPHLSVAVVGVAVATALVPPLAASGILFANGEIQLGLGAALLAVTNIIAIQFTNAMVLWFLGFRRLINNDYKTSNFFTFLQRNSVTLLLLIGLGSYLTINLNKNARQQTFESNVKETINQYFSDKGNVLTNSQFDETGDNQVVRAVIRGETTPSSYDVQQIEAIITQDIKDNFPSYLPIKIQLRYLPVRVIESDPFIQDKLDRTDAAILTH